MTNDQLNPGYPKVQLGRKTETRPFGRIQSGSAPQRSSLGREGHNRGIFGLGTKCADPDLWPFSSAFRATVAT